LHVSFVIPLYNCLPLTQAMLASLTASLPRDLEYEIIFVDDGSTDGTRDWLRQLPLRQARHILNPENLGYAAANNRGAAVARGEYLALLNNDLLLSPGWLQPMLALAKSPDAGAIGNVQRAVNTGEIDHAGIVINAKGKPAHDRSPPNWRERRREHPAVTGACLLMQHALWSKLGGFDEGFVNGCEDVDLCLRAKSHRRHNRVALDSVVLHHVSASPGRKKRDEANTRRLTLRWKDELALHGCRAWCEEYVAKHLNAAVAFAQPLPGLRVLSYALGLSSTPPPLALHGMQRAIARELQRWDALLGTA
jgi:O-antigen biosynthesis protein